MVQVNSLVEEDSHGTDHFQYFECCGVRVSDLCAGAIFTREFVYQRKGFAEARRLSQVDMGHSRSRLEVGEKVFARAGREQRAEYEAVMRKEVVAGALIGLVGLLAPFIFVMLLNSPWLR